MEIDNRNTQVKVFLFFLISIFFCLLVIQNTLAEEIVKHVDANGNVFFTNEKLPQVTPRKQTDLPVVKAYYVFCDALAVAQNLIEQNATVTRANIENLTAGGKAINDEMTASALMSGGKMSKRISLLSGSYQGVAKVIGVEAKAAGDQGNKTLSVLLYFKAQFCSSLAMKVMADSIFQENSIDFTRVNIDDSVCFLPSSTQSADYEIPEDADEVIETTCKRKWKDDFEMVEYCINNQEEAKNNIAEYSGPILVKCAEKWKYDFEMIEYCTKNQTEAKERLGY